LKIEPLNDLSKVTSQGLFSISGGTVMINPDPDNISAPWTLTGPNSYSQSGVGDQTLTSLAPGDYSLTWGDVPGWTKPTLASETKAVISGGTITFSGTYVQQLGSLTVTISPQGAIDAGAQWKRVGTATWFNSGSTESSIPVGAYTVEFKPVTGWTTPSSAGVTISNGVTATIGRTYVRKTDPIIQVTPSSLNFGYVAVGSTKDLNLTVKNAGGGTLTGNATTTVPFSIVSGGSYNLNSDQSQVVTIRYQPTSEGSHTGTVVFTGGDGATVPVTGKVEKPSGLSWLLLLLGN
jgi:Abnormal spindle-like microcephaly-assoc'd, ASPM-SPD-2-Hydin